MATWGYDKPALAQILRKTPAYVVLVASPMQAMTIFEGISKEGIADEKLESERIPAGLDIGAGLTLVWLTLPRRRRLH